MVRAHCTNCDLMIHVAVLDVTVSYGVGASEGEFHLECPSCDGIVRGQLRPDTAMALATSGARLLDPNAPITDEEIERFVSGLEQTDVIGRELASFAH